MLYASTSTTNSQTTNHGKIEIRPKFCNTTLLFYFSKLEIYVLRLCNPVYFTPILETDCTVVDEYTWSNY